MAHRHAFKWLIASALIVLMVMGIHWILDKRHGAGAVTARAAQLPRDRPRSVICNVPSPRATAKRQAKRGAADVEVCGVGRIPESEDDPGGNSYVGDLTKPALMRWLAALRNSDDYRARATGIFVSTVLEGRHAEKGATQEAREELVAMAVTSADPAIYAVALKECAFTAADAASACAQLSPRGWAKLDPDNAAAWLLVAARALENRDIAAEAAAFTQASRAHRSDSYNYSLLQYAAPDMPSDATPLERWSLAINVIGIEAAFVEPFRPTFLHCSQEAVLDNTVAQQCNSLAELWVTHPTTVLDLVMGRLIGAQVGWSAKRIADLTEKTNAYMQVLTEATPSEPDNEWTCKGVEQGNAYIAKLTRMSEIGVMQELLELSPHTVAELSRKHTEFMEKMLEEAPRQTQKQGLP